MPTKRGRRADIPDFKKIKKKIENNIKRTARTVIKQFAHDLRKELVHGILSQKFESFLKNPLNAEYLRRKRRKGLDPRILISTHHYVKSIRVHQISENLFEVNVPKDAKAFDENRLPTKLSLRMLGAIHEYGSASKGIPPRPHWRPILEQGKNKATKLTKQIVKETTKKISRDLSRG